ncbi:MAG: MurR/RpiR family transcriptional regulator [Anaerolineae bacterium]
MVDKRVGPGADLLLAIRGLLPALNEQEAKVGRYVLVHPAEVIHLSMSELGERCGVSDATVFRFCRRVGTEGYQDFKIRLAQTLAMPGMTAYLPITAQDSLQEAAGKVIADDIKALEDTLKLLDLSMLGRAVEALLAARRVDIYGSGGAAIAALELQYKLIRVGIRGVAHTDAEMQTISAALLTPADLAVGISHSGEAYDVRHAMEVAKESGAKLIAITNHPASAISELADIHLYTAAEESFGQGYPMGTRVAQVALIDVLYACLALKRGEESERSLARISAVLYHKQA